MSSTRDPELEMACALMAERRGQMRVHKTSSCHLWLGSTGGTGYGKLMVCKMWWQPHRFAWILANGEPIPVGMDVMHSCDTPACCNPAHLSVGTRSQNMKDAVAKGRWHSYGAGLNRTHCRNGHAYDEENTRVTAKGVRICRVCAAESSRRYREKV